MQRFIFLLVIPDCMRTRLLILFRASASSRSPFLSGFRFLLSVVSQFADHSVVSHYQTGHENFAEPPEKFQLQEHVGCVDDVRFHKQDVRLSGSDNACGPFNLCYKWHLTETVPCGEGSEFNGPAAGICLKDRNFSLDQYIKNPLRRIFLDDQRVFRDLQPFAHRQELTKFMVVEIIKKRDSLE